MRILAKWVICMTAVLVACALFPNTVYASDMFLAAFAAGSILFVINMTIKPIMQIIALPVSCLTLGIGALLVNALMVKIADALLPFVDFGSFWVLVFVAVLVSIGTAVFDSNRKKAE